MGKAGLRSALASSAKDEELAALKRIIGIDDGQLDAETSSGEEAVRGVIARPDAPYAVQLLSASGDLSVEGRS